MKIRIMNWNHQRTDSTLLLWNLPLIAQVNDLNHSELEFYLQFRSWGGGELSRSTFRPADETLNLRLSYQRQQNKSKNKKKKEDELKPAVSLTYPGIRERCVK